MSEKINEGRSGQKKGYRKVEGQEFCVCFYLVLFCSFINKLNQVNKVDTSMQEKCHFWDVG